MFKTLANASAFSLALIAMPSALCAQMADPPQTPAPPDIPMPPGSPVPLLPPVEVPSEPATPDVQPEHIAKKERVPTVQFAYPPCSATIQDQCMNTRPEADIKAVRPIKKVPHRRHHKR